MMNFSSTSQHFILVCIAICCIPFDLISQSHNPNSVSFAESSQIGLTEVNPPAAPFNAKLMVISGARLIDGTGREMIENSVVVIDGSRITEVGRKDEVKIPEDADHYDASDYTLLPGLIDAHFHNINNNGRLSLMLKNGTTTFRDPGHPFRFYQSLNFADQLLPRVFLTGAHLDGYPGVYKQQAALIQNADHAREKVYDHVRNGSSGIKIYFRLPLEYYDPIIQAARVNHIPVFAHLELVSALDAIRAGINGIEHVTSCGTALAEPDEAQKFRDTVYKNSSARSEWRYRLWSTIDLQSERVKQLIDAMVANNVYFSPTLTVFERRMGDKGVEEYQAQGFSNMLEFVKLAHEGGVNIVIGSHNSGPRALPGMAYQREMELFVEAGMTPMEVIQSSTLLNAHYLRTAGRIGSIEKGKLADLILIDGNPLEDISDMKKVSRVMLNGQWMTE